MNSGKSALLMFALTIAMGTSISAANDIEQQVKNWLQKPAPERSDFLQQPFAKEILTRKQAAAIQKALVDDFKNRIRKKRSEEWKARKIKLDKLEMKFEFRVFGKKPAKGRSLFISMHGGGGAPARVNDQQWRNQIVLYQPAEGLYIAPRAPTDTWNLWHQSHIDLFFQRLIENAIVFEDVDPNRVYIMGYSAGGDGVYQLAPRMADTLAAAAMMAGHPNDASPLGLRNIGFTLHMGGRDSAYNRNKVAREWKVKLEKLRTEDTNGYRHLVQIHEKYGHWMNRDDRVAIPWMAKFQREPFPNRVVWHQSNVVHDRYYWLAVNKKNQIGKSLLIANRKGQEIRIEKVEKVKSVNIRLNDSMLDLDQPVVLVRPDGKSIEKKPQRTAAMLYRSLKERFDPIAIYSAEIPFSLD